MKLDWKTSVSDKSDLELMLKTCSLRLFFKIRPIDNNSKYEASVCIQGKCVNCFQADTLESAKQWADQWFTDFSKLTYDSLST